MQLNYSKEKEETPEKAASEEELAFVRCVFACMINGNDLTSEVMETIDELEKLNTSSKETPTQQITFIENLKTQPEFGKICRRWNNANKIRIWYKRRIDEIKDTFIKNAEEKLKQEKEEKEAEEKAKAEKEGKKTEDEKKEDKKEDSKENTEENKAEEGKAEEGKAEEVKTAENKEEDKKEDPNEETIDTATGASKAKEPSGVDMVKINKEIDVIKNKLLKNFLEKADLLTKLVTPVYWDQREQERRRQSLSTKDISSSKKMSSKRLKMPRKARRKQTSLYMDKIGKKDVFDHCQSSVIAYFKHSATPKDIQDRLEELFICAKSR